MDEFYDSKEGAIYHVIAPALDVPGDTDINDFNADGIFEEAFSYDNEAGAYRQTATGKAFWAIVDKYAL